MKYRIFVYANDLELLTGKGPRYCRELFNDICTALGKEKDKLVTCCELGEYLNLEPEVIYKTINKLPLLPD